MSPQSGKRIYGGKHAKTLAKIQVGAIFQVRDIRRNNSPKFIDLYKETPCWCPSERGNNMAGGNQYCP